MTIKLFSHLGIDHATPLEALLHAALVPTALVLVGIITITLALKHLQRTHQKSESIVSIDKKENF